MIRQAILVIVSLWPVAGLVKEPLSAIDWFTPDSSSQSPRIVAPPVPVPLPPTKDGEFRDLKSTPLPLPSVDSAGLLPPEVTGFPADIWAMSQASQVVERLASVNIPEMPAIQALLRALLLAEAEPPPGLTHEGAFLAARARKLMEMGAVDHVHALLHQLRHSNPALFNIYLEAAILHGSTVEACNRLADNPRLTNDFSVRIFCLARDGQWDNALLMANNAQALDLIDSDMAIKLAQFFDPDSETRMAVQHWPTSPSPLDVEVARAIGVPIDTKALPVAFLRRELSGLRGWQAQVEAAERLVATGAIAPQHLRGLLWRGELPPAPHKQVWGRIASLRNLELALESGNGDRIVHQLKQTREHMRQAGLEAALAEAFAPELGRISALASNESTLFRLLLLTPDHARHAREWKAGNIPAMTEDLFLASLALGHPREEIATGIRQRAVAQGFKHPPPEHIRTLLDERRLGEAALEAIQLYQSGRAGNLLAMRAAIAAFRAARLEETARRAGLQYLLLHPSG